MSLQIRANRISKRELPHGVRFVEFKYVYEYNCEFQSSFNIITQVDHELEIAWTIKASSRDSYRIWNEIKLEKCEKNVYGAFTIKSSNDSNFTRGNFDASSLPYEKSLGIHCNCGNRIIIILEIYRNYVATSLFGDYEKLLDNEKSCDVVFVIGEEEIRAHKLIVQERCNIFATMFYSDMLEKKTGRVEITDIEPDIFKMFLQFLYCGKFESNDIEEILKLIMAANKYSMLTLISMCAYRLSCKLCADNAVDILIVADRVNVDFLKEECIELICNNRWKFVNSESWKKLRKFHSDLALEILDSIMEKSTEQKT